MTWARGVAAVVLSLGLALFGIWMFGWSSNLDPIGAVLGHPAQVEVPDLAGLAEPRAVADVHSADLLADVESAPSLTSPRGAVISQHPRAGTEVDIGSVVEVVVSEGITRIEMPKAVGQPFEDVVVPLDEAGVDYTVDRVASETVAEGIVIEQVPEPGRRVTAADDVRFTVSTGPDPRAVVEVAGLSAEGAAYALGLGGFDVEAVLRDDPVVPAGVVIGTEPVATTVLPRDSLVKVVTSAGPPAVPLPDLSGFPLESALGRLSSLGLVANTRGGGASGATVAAQQPAAGTPVRVGDMVLIEARGG
jgi:serine/threonine-protein kinase